MNFDALHYVYEYLIPLSALQSAEPHPMKDIGICFRALLEISIFVLNEFLMLLLRLLFILVPVADGDQCRSTLIQ